MGDQFYSFCATSAETNFLNRLVENPIVLDFREILQKYDQITAPITLVCAGNRRKEQNTVRKSKGFSWGAAGLSTALFTGPMMADILRSAKPMRRAKYVCMEGADQLVGASIPFHSTTKKLTIPAERSLWHIGQIKLGNAFQQRYHVGSQDERRVAETRSRPAFTGCCPRPDWRAECQMAEETDID